MSATRQQLSHGPVPIWIRPSENKLHTDVHAPVVFILTYKNCIGAPPLTHTQNQRAQLETTNERNFRKQEKRGYKNKTDRNAHVLLMASSISDIWSFSWFHCSGFREMPEDGEAARDGSAEPRRSLKTPAHLSSPASSRRPGSSSTL